MGDDREWDEEAETDDVVIDLRDSTLAAEGRAAVEAAAEAALRDLRPDEQVEVEGAAARPAAEAVWLAADRDFLGQVLALDEATSEDLPEV